MEVRQLFIFGRISNEINAAAIKRNYCKSLKISFISLFVIFLWSAV